MATDNLVDHPSVSTPVRAVHTDVIDVSMVFRALARKWWLLLLFAGIGLINGYMNLQSFQPAFEARMIVAPAGGSTSPTQSLRGIASTIGLQVQGSDEATPFDRLMIVVGSLTFANRLQQDYGLLQEIYSSNWDAERQEWMRPTGSDFERRESIRSFLRMPTWQPPSEEQLAEYLGGVLEFKEMKDSPFFVVSTQNTDRERALELLRLVYFEADEMLRQQDRTGAVQRKGYLLGQLQNENRNFLRDVLLQLLAQEEQKAMLLKSDVPYAARVVEPPFVSSSPSAPNFPILIGVPIVFWVGIAAFAVVIIALYRWETK